MYAPLHFKMTRKLEFVVLAVLDASRRERAVTIVNLAVQYVTLTELDAGYSVE